MVDASAGDRCHGERVRGLESRARRTQDGPLDAHAKDCALTGGAARSPSGAPDGIGYNLSTPRRPRVWGIRPVRKRTARAKVAELVDALDLGSSGETRESSSLSFRINCHVHDAAGREHGYCRLRIMACKFL